MLLANIFNSFAIIIIFIMHVPLTHTTLTFHFLSSKRPLLSPITLQISPIKGEPF